MATHLKSEAKSRKCGLEMVGVGDEPVRAIADAAADHDAVVMGESGDSLRSFLFGDSAERVAASSLCPVLVVRNERDDEAEGTDESGEQESGA